MKYYAFPSLKGFDLAADLKWEMKLGSETEFPSLKLGFGQEYGQGTSRHLLMWENTV